MSGTDKTGQYIEYLSLPRNKTSSAYSGRLMDVLRVNARAAYGHALDWRFWQFWGKVDWFKKKVATGEEWDFKLAAKKDWRHDDVLAFRGMRISAEEFGNIHYGYTGAAMRLPWWALSAGSYRANGWTLDLNETFDQFWAYSGYVLYYSLLYPRKGSGGPSEYWRTYRYD